MDKKAQIKEMTIKIYKHSKLTMNEAYELSVKLFDREIGNVVQAREEFAEKLKERKKFYAGRVVAVGLDTIDELLKEYDHGE